MSLGNPEIVALVSALGGGVAVKIIDYIASRSSKKTDELGEFRKELRQEVTDHKKEVKEAEEKFDKLQAEYYALVVKCGHELALLAHLKEENEILRKKVEARK